MNLYARLLKPLFFLLPAERAHGLVMAMMKLMLLVPGKTWFFEQVFKVKDAKLQRKELGIVFPNPVGLAAGFDKNGEHINEMAALGFGFIELGTVTPKAQDGNEKPRLFRLPNDKALINRMGFNNLGVENLARNLEKYRPKNIIIGGNIGKNKNTPNEEAARDYAYCFEALFPFVDYFVVNVSSPNTPGLRALQEKGPLTKLLNHLQNLNRQKVSSKPILLKIAPDLTDEQLDDILDIVGTTSIAGVIATNTTINRDGLNTSTSEIDEIGAGGLSGQPLKSRSTVIIQYLNEKSKGQLFIIASGGIASGEDALEKLDAGASLVQIYTGLVYEGPGLVKKINKAILKRSSGIFSQKAHS